MDILAEPEYQLSGAAGTGLGLVALQLGSGFPMQLKSCSCVGHKYPRFHKMMLDQAYEWDAVQMPPSVLDAQYDRSFGKEILPICVERGIAVLAMKVPGGGHLQRANVVSPREAHEYVYDLPVATLISGMDMPEHLRASIETAATYQPLAQEEKETILSKAHDPAVTGEYEPFKTSWPSDSSIGRELHGLI